MGSGSVAGMKISARNQLRGTVRTITEGAANRKRRDRRGRTAPRGLDHVEAAHELDLQPGKEVVAIVKASDVLVATD